MRNVLLVVFAVILSTVSMTAQSWETKSKEIYTDDQVEVFVVDSEIDFDTLKALKGAIARVSDPASKKTLLDVRLSSPGGNAIAGLEMAVMLRKLSDNGKVKVATTADVWCASACTWLLASGTPGFRTIDKDALTLVHALQSGRGGCVAHKEKDDEPSDKISNAIIELGRDLYMRFTGKDQKTVEKWLSCGFEQVGRGQLLVDLGMADSLSK